MAKQPGTPATDTIAPLVSFLGLSLSGDLGPYTVYTNRNGRIVFYPRSPPTAPPSPAQLKQRQRFRAAQQSWQAIAPTTKHQWELLVKANKVCMTGQNMYMALSMNPDNDALTTANLRAGLSLSPPPFIPN